MIPYRAPDREGKKHEKSHTPGLPMAVVPFVRMSILARNVPADKR